MSDEDHKLQVGALEIATKMQKAGLEGERRELIERVDVRNQSVHIVPVNDSSLPLYDDEFDTIEEFAEESVEDYPFTVSEWWFSKYDSKQHLVVSPYWPTGGQLTKEQLDHYDKFVCDNEATS